MIWVLRHMGIHLWVSTLFAIPLSFYALTFLLKFFPFANPMIFSAFIFIGMITFFGFLMDLAAKKQVRNLIKEGQAWERSGIFKKAEKAYTRALRVYDTFLLWPFSAKNTALKLSKAIAGFYLRTHSDGENFKQVTTMYLKMNPQDADIAGMWLARIKQAGFISSLDQEVLSAFAEVYPANTSLGSETAKLLSNLQGNDYIAKETHSRVFNQPDLDLSKEYRTKIGDIKEEPEKPKVIQREYFSFIKDFVKSIDLTLYFQWIFVRIKSFVKITLSLAESLLSFCVLSCQRFISYFKDHEKAQVYLKTGILTIAGVSMAFFIISTLAHTFKTRALEKKEIARQASIPKPFTIQVAAYLTLPHAQSYVDLLKKKQIDASIKKVDGGGKTWFVVRVSKFVDKKSAADYGKILKQQGTIDDFFVNNR